jgi:hypothetical protein
MPSVEGVDDSVPRIGYGVYGRSVNSYGVLGESNNSIGLAGSNVGNIGVVGSGMKIPYTPMYIWIYTSTTTWRVA